MKVKVAFGEDIRHWHYPSQNRYQHLVSFVEQTLKCDPQKKKAYYLLFEDAEMDKVTISNEQDLLDAFECAEQENRPSLKIYVVQGSITETHEGASDQTKETKETKENENDTQSNEKCVGSESSNSFCERRKLGLEFLLDEKINALLPKLVERVISELHESRRNGNEVSLSEVVPRVLEDKTFEDIVRHPLYQNYVQPLLPMLLARASCCTNILLSLNEETVGAWFSGIMNLVTTSLANGHCLGAPLHMFFSTFQNGNDNDDEDEDGKNVGEAVHYGVQCDVCKVYPIQGIRYKCSVCPNYDLCEKCESSGQHYPGHPLLKMVQPMCRRNFGMNHFPGLEEVMGRRCPRRQGEVESEFSGHGFRHGRFRHPCWMKFAHHPHKAKCHQKETNFCKKNKQDKLRNRKEKLEKKLDKINCKLNGNENVEAENLLQIKCICGEGLVPISPKKAYRCAQVVCDRCEINCSGDKTVFHCPVEKSLQHPGGYDVCMKCAKNDESGMSSCDSSPKREEPKQEPAVSSVTKEEVVNIEPVNIEPMKNEEEVDPFKKFLYADEGHALVEMGFTDYDRIRRLLLEKKGNVDAVLAELLKQ